MNKKEDKFKFVTNEETVKEVSDIDNINIVDTPSEVIAEPIEKEESVSNNKDFSEDLKGRFHLSFELRVIIMIIVILLLFGGACLLILESLNYSKNNTVKYDEISKVNYQICLKGEDSSCLDEGMEYDSSLIKSINTTFDYNVTFSKNIQYGLAYHISAITNIYDLKDKTKVLHSDEKIIVDRTEINDNKNSINIYKDITYDYIKDNKYVVDYKDMYKDDYVADVEIILYLDEESETRKVASITVPFNSKDFEIKKFNISNVGKEVKVYESSWNDYSTICATLASILIILSLFLIYRTTRLVLRVTNNRSKYQQRLIDILREYDRIIVIARDGYESNVARNEVKLDSFDKLLDVKDRLSKPIIFSKVNEVKCEFIVEDDETLYKYVLKDDE